MLNSRVFASIVTCLLLSASFAFSPSRVFSSPDPVVRIVDPQTGESSKVIGNSSQPMPQGGYPFTVNVTLENIQNLWDYQVSITYNQTMMNCTAAWVEKNDTNYVFHSFGDNSIILTPLFQTDFALLGASIAQGDDTMNVSGSLLLCQFNFKAFRIGTSNIEFRLYPHVQMFDTSLQQRFPPDPNPVDVSFSTQNMTVTVEAGPSPPVASFTFSPTNPQQGENVTFDASQSYDPDGTIASYFWNFGNGVNASTTDSTVVHVFDSNGTFQVTLTVYDNDGMYDSLTSGVTVAIVPEFTGAVLISLLMVLTFFVAVLCKKRARTEHYSD